MTAWRESLRSWLGIAIGVLIGVPSVGRIVSGDGHPFNVLAVIGALALLVPSALLRLDADHDGFTVWPFPTRVRWDDVDWVEAKGNLLASVRVHRLGVPRPTVITVQPISVGRATRVAERLNDAAALHKGTS